MSAWQAYGKAKIAPVYAARVGTLQGLKVFVL